MNMLRLGLLLGALSAPGLVTGQGAFVEADGLLVIEMESAASLPEFWKVGPAPDISSPNVNNGDGATGIGYIVWEGAQSLGNPGNGEIVYDIVIQNPGEYRFRWRNQVGRGTNTTEHNGTWLKIESDAFFGRKNSGSIVCPAGLDPLQNDCVGSTPNGRSSGGWFKVYSSGANDWSFSTRTSDNDAHDIFARFDAAGSYQIRVSSRSSSHVIDRMVLDSELFVDNPASLDLPESDRLGASIIRGELRQWHRVTVDFDGPASSETAAPNPFLDFRLDVTFSQGEQSYTVPGYFAGDGNGGAAGSVWRARFSPPTAGTWSYVASFRSGAEVAVAASPTAGIAAAPDGVSGSFVVSASDKVLPDFRAASGGLVKNRGNHYLTYDGGEPWIKGGPDVPENFLGYDGFDNTPDAGHSFNAHLSDWNAGDPDFNDGQGKRIIGALNFIAESGANVIYFLPMNIGGDGKDTFPTITTNDKTRYDLSKLAQWEIVFSHAQARGIFLHFVLAETESANENYHDNGTLGPQRKLFYRMLLALFGHHNGLQLNIGEENDYGATKHAQFAAFIKAVDAYDHPVTTHTRGGQYDQYYNPLLANPDIDMTSFQGGNSRSSMFDLIQTWRGRSFNAGVPWAISFDEPQKIENDVDDYANGYPHGRRDKMWPVFMAGGGGFEWYVQQDGGGHSFDQQIDDFNLMADALAWTGHALDFLALLPLQSMSSSRTLGSSSSGGNTYALIRPGESYALYNDRNGGVLSLDLPAGQYEVKWFDPRNGGGLLDGTVSQVSGGTEVAIGEAPYARDDDWAALIRRVDGAGNLPPAVAITAPGSGATFTAPANVTVQASASDSDGEVVEVEFFLDGVSRGVDDLAPFETRLTDLPAGGYTVTAVAVDDDDAVSSADVFFRVNDPDGMDAPEVTRLVLVNAQTDQDIEPLLDQATYDLSQIGTALNVRAEVTGPVASVAFQREGDVLHSQTENVAPYAMNGDSNGDYNVWAATPGSYQLSVTPYTGANAGGDAGETLIVGFTLSEGGGNLAPVATINQPGDGARFEATDVIIVAVDASDPDGTIDNVELFVDSLSQGQVATPPYTWSLTALAPGSHVLEAMALDDFGALSEAETVSIEILRMPQDELLFSSSFEEGR